MACNDGVEAGVGSPILSDGRNCLYDAVLSKAYTTVEQHKNKTALLSVPIPYQYDQQKTSVVHCWPALPQ